MQATFHRDGQYLVLQRHDDPDLALVIVGEQHSRRIPFAGLDALVTFQWDMEQFLVRTGWSLVNFVPDRRQYADRRAFPRVGVDRRRWWSDPRPVIASDPQHD